MPHRTIVILVIVSALATVCYLSLWSSLDYSSDGSVLNDIHTATNRFRPHQTQDQEAQPSPLQQSMKNDGEKPRRPLEQPQQQQQPMVTRNNARLAAQDNKAFVSFCSANQVDRDAASSIVLENDATFTTYTQWIEHINNKHMPRQQQQQQQQPMFMERPLNGWVINLTSMAEPCNRLIHSSAHCLKFLTQEHEYLIPATPEQKATTTEAPIMDFHIFWRGPISDKLSLSAHSFIFTQPLDRSHLHLWIDSADFPNGEPEDYTQNQFSAPLVSHPLNKHISIHAWNQAAELKYAYPEDAEDKDDDDMDGEVKELEQKEAPKPVALSDEARFLILNRNGGIYLDADVLLLKDMSPFYDSGLEFAYEWSRTRMYNTAILRLFKDSTVARRILDGARAREKEIITQKLQVLQQEVEERKEQQLAKRGEMRPDEIYHPARLRKYLRPQDGQIEGNGLIMMSPAVFDPNWLRVDNAEAKSADSEKMVEDLKSFPDAFSVEEAVCPFQMQQQQAPQFTAGPEVFFQGAYAYHWHNNWATHIEPKGWMGHMRQAYDDFVAGRRPNLYGEMF